MTTDDRRRPVDESTASGDDASGPDTPTERSSPSRVESPSNRGPPSQHRTERSPGPLTRLRTANSGPLLVVREMLTSLVAVAAVGLLLFAVSGVWPPMVAVESGSMEPHMQKGDLIFITEPGRFTSDAAYGETGVVTAVDGERADYRTFGGYGSVVVYDNPARYGSPVIHRAHFWVDDGENWYDRANPDYISADDCGELTHCPAPNAGFITKGDANGRYDQANGISRPVKPSWITGVARVRVPYLGWIRLGIAQTVLAQPAPADAVGVAPNATAESSVATDANGTTDVTPDVATNVTPDVATNVTPDDVAPTPTPTPGVPAVRPTDARRPPVDPTGTPSSATAAA